METVTLGDKNFRLYITEREILAAVKKVAAQINNNYIGKRPLLLPMLNGSFMFASDLMKELTLDCNISFIKYSSYEGTSSSGNVQSLLGLQESILGREVIIVEDIVDTGNTLAHVLPLIQNQQPASIRIASLLLKPDALKHPLHIDYVGKEIPNEFIVGYGLDYNGLGRNLRNIYQITV